MTELAHANGATFETLVHLEQTGFCTPTGLDLDGVKPTYEQWFQLVLLCSEIRRRSSWYVADALVYGEQRFGEKYAQAEQITGLSEHTLQNYCSVASKIPMARRIEGKNLHWHAPVASLGPREQRSWLGRANREGWNRDRLRDALRDAAVLPRAGRVALGEAQEKAIRRIVGAKETLVAAAIERDGGWWVPASVWEAFVAA